MPERRATVTVVEQLARILERHEGPTGVRVRLERSDVERVLEVPIHVKVSAALFSELKGLLGPSVLAERR